MSGTAFVKKTVSVGVVNAFVVDGQGGNPAGVVLDADDLGEVDMQAVAARVGLSETAFVSRSDVAGFRLDFFTPNRRIPHCGHATIATFSYLAEQGRVGDGETSKQTIEGPRKIVMRDGMAFMEQLAPAYRASADWVADGVTEAQLLASIGLSADHLDPRFGPVIVNTGNSFALVAVRSGEDLGNLTPDMDAISAISEKLDLIGYYVFTTDATATSGDATTRMFAPRFAIPEEAATGMAAGPLACLLQDSLPEKKATWIIEQGHYMATPSPSRITVELDLDGDRITGLLAGGYGRLMREMTVTLD
ncbi:MAG: PhzF family phenazine biosynthesis protein [Rhodospirillales bacterium]